MASDFTIVIYNGKIAAMSLPGGQIWRYARQRSVRVEKLAARLAPRRTGWLRSTIKAQYNPAPPQHVIMEVHATARHARWVHEGTYGPIMSRGPMTPNGPSRMNLKPWGPWPAVSLVAVRGQRSQPFLSRALDAVMRDL